MRSQILAHMNANALKENDRLPSEREIARMTGVNVNTVGKVYRQLVDEGYLSRDVGRGTFVTSGLTKGKFLILVYQRHLQPGALFNRQLFDSTEDILREKGYAIEIIEVPYRNDAWLDSNRALYNRLAGGVYAGVFTGGIALTALYSDMLRECRIPVLSVGYPPVNGCNDFFYTDYEDLYRKACALLRERQSRAPVFICGETEIVRDGKFLPADTELLSLCSKAGVPYLPERHIRLPWSKMNESGFEEIRSFLAGREFDAVVCDNDIYSEITQLALFALQIDMKERIMVAHANRGLDRLIVVPVKKIYFDTRAFAERLSARMTELADSYEGPQNVPVTIRFED
ncbi:MAG: GntR family transcriptional regulator [Spirochaetota bacterium]